MTTDVPRSRPLASALLTYLLPPLASSLLCAVLVTYLIRTGDGFKVNVILAACITAIAMLLGTGGRLLLHRRRVHQAGMALMLALLAPVSFFIGKAIADRLISRPPAGFTLNAPDATTGIIALSLLAFATGLLLYRIQEKTAALAVRAALLDMQDAQTHLRLLEAHIKPHLLFDTLAMLQTLVSVEPLRAQQMLNQLVQYLRATLSSIQQEHTTLAREAELLKAYLGLMSLRMGFRLTYRLQLPDELQRLRIAPMLLQPLVENAIRHGLDPKPDGGDCTVRVLRHDDVLVMSVFDTGKGLPALGSYNRPGSDHSGLETIRTRLETRYGPLAELTLTHNIPEGTVAQITIPIAALAGAPGR